jgi:hypothetical protein
MYRQFCVLCVLLLLRVVNLCLLLLCIETVYLLQFLYYCCVCFIDDIVAVETKHCTFVEGCVYLCVYLLPCTQSVPLTKTKRCQFHHRWNSWYTD